MFSSSPKNCLALDRVVLYNKVGQSVTQINKNVKQKSVFIMSQTLLVKSLLSRTLDINSSYHIEN